jgi:hypothetical protein
VVDFEKLRFIIEISGDGDLSFIEPPSVELPDGIELFNVKRIDLREEHTPGATARSRFEYLLVPKTVGSKTIAPVSFSYFDPIHKSYKNIQTMPVNVEVYENPEKLATDLLPVRPRVESHQAKSNFKITRKRSFIVLITVGISCIALFWKRICKTFQGLLIAMKQKFTTQRVRPDETSVSLAADRLRTVEEMLERKDFSTFYYELNKALWSVITEKIDLRPTELNKCNILVELDSRGWTPEERWNLERTMNEYERNLYIPGYREESDFAKAYAKALQIIDKFYQ